jgi:hypothetical protein
MELFLNSLRIRLLKICGILHRKFRHWQHLSYSERLLFMQALALFAIVAIGISLLGLQRLQRILTRRIESLAAVSPILGVEILSIETTTQLVEMAARYVPWWGNCLKRSLVLWYLLRRQGQMSQLRIGVRREQGRFEAHAWVEYENRVLNDSSTVHQQFFAFDAAIEI